MLQKLHIQNYAIIESVSIDFSKDLNIITGETGAGKSILIGALSLILGERAESNILNDKNKKLVVEGYFTTDGNTFIKEFFKENDLDLEEEVVVRREIAINGKSRAFVNDTPVNLTQIKRLGALLVDLHQQFDTFELSDNNFQREVLDALADNGGLIKQFNVEYTTYLATKKLLDALQEQQQQATTAADYNGFLYNELAEANLSINELEMLDDELKLLTNAENIKQQLSSIYFDLEESEQPLVQHIKTMVNKLHSIQQYHASVEEISNRLQSLQVELGDISDELERINNAIQYNPERIQIVNDRILMGYKLLKKHQVKTTDELIFIKNELSKKLADILKIGDIILQKQKETELQFAQCDKIANQISGNRHKILSFFEEKVNTLLAKVGMPNAKFKVALTNISIAEHGKDAIEFLFNANVAAGELVSGKRFEPLRKVASGGELSRIMLCVKSLVAKKLQLPTLIFDEIDTGISGEAAKQVGEIMKSLSAAHQVISITHQPQIAAKATAHYFVYKAITDNKITTSIRQLSDNERIIAIAQMLSGEKPTAAALENAREMVNS
jgi:DNA repair protein RecN (Recombination protein N)